MKQLRNLSIAALTVLTVATAAGCGQQGLAGAPVGYSAMLPAAMDAMGVTRKFGFNWDKFNQQAHAPRHLPRQGMLPSQVDNRQWCSPVADQGQLGACTAFSMGHGLREYMEIKSGQKLTSLSPLFLYYNERVVDGDVNQDGGSTLTTGMGVLKDTGICPESDDVYNPATFTVKPSTTAYSDAAEFKTHDNTQLASVDDMKTALAAGNVCVGGFTVYKSFMSIGADGMMPLPKKGEKVLGGHAICIVGYDDAKQVLIIRNSWGPAWGDHGYFYMPYAFATQSKLFNDFWTASK